MFQLASYAQDDDVAKELWELSEQAPVKNVLECCIPVILCSKSINVMDAAFPLLDV
jgi:hypothetical protein